MRERREVSKMPEDIRQVDNIFYLPNGTYNTL